MTKDTEKIQGVDVNVEDLLNVQKRLSGLSLRNLKKISSLGSGSRRTRIRGRGMEYEESRAYVVGDDVKTMDWRVMARTGEAHTKVFAEEKESSLLLALDLSSSMFFGTRYSLKSWAASQLAAHLGWLASFAGDRIGGLVVSTDDYFSVKPGKTHTGLMTLFHRLAQACDQTLPVNPEAGRLNIMLGQLQRSARAGSIIILISDFLGIDKKTSELLQSLVKHHNLIAFWIYDKTETESWRPGHYPVKTQSQKFILDSNSVSGSSWLSRQQQNHRTQVESLMSKYNIGLRALSCNRDITSQLAPYLK